MTRISKGRIFGLQQWGIFPDTLKISKMTTLQQTKAAYQRGLKHIAYLSFLADPNSRKDTSFEAFCQGMDKMTKS